MAITKRTVNTNKINQEDIETINKVGIKKGQVLYYAQIMPTLSIYEVIEGVVRSVDEDWFCILEKDGGGSAKLFENFQFNKIVFNNRGLALEKVLEAQLINE